MCRQQHPYLKHMICGSRGCCRLSSPRNAELPIATHLDSGVDHSRGVRQDDEALPLRLTRRMNWPLHLRHPIVSTPLRFLDSPLPQH